MDQSYSPAHIIKVNVMPVLTKVVLRVCAILLLVGVAFSVFLSLGSLLLMPQVILIVPSTVLGTIGVFSIIGLLLSVTYAILLYRQRKWIIPIAIPVSSSFIIFTLLELFRSDVTGLYLVLSIVTLGVHATILYILIRYWSNFLGEGVRPVLQILSIVVALPYFVFFVLTQVYQDDQSVDDAGLLLAPAQVVPEQHNAYTYLPDLDELTETEESSLETLLALSKNNESADYGQDELRQHVLNLGQEIEAFTQASLQPEYQCPSTTNEHSVSAELCDPGDLRKLSLLLQVKSRIDIANDDFDEALGSALSILQMGRLVFETEQPLLIENILALALIETGFDAVEVVLDSVSDKQHQFDTTLFVQLLSEIDSLQLDGSGLAMAHKREYLLMQSMMTPASGFVKFFWQPNKTLNTVADITRHQLTVDTTDCGFEYFAAQSAAKESINELLTADNSSILTSPNVLGRELISSWSVSPLTTREAECNLLKNKKDVSEKIFKYAEHDVFAQHALRLFLLRDPDVDRDGLVDSMEVSVYYTDPEVFDSQLTGVSDGQYVYDNYIESFRSGNFDTIEKWQKRQGDQGGKIVSLNDQFNLRGQQTYNFYVGTDKELLEILSQAQQYRAEDRIVDSIVLLEEALEKFPDDAKIRFSIARAKHMLGEYDTALETYLPLYEKREIQSPLLLQDIASAYYEKGQTKLYEQFQGLSIELYPEELSQYIELAGYLRQENRLDEAEDIIMKGLSVEPRYADFYNQLAIIAATKNDAEREIEMYKTAVKHDFAYSAGHFNLGLLYGDSFNDKFVGHSPNQEDLREALIETLIAYELNPTSRYETELVLLYARAGEIAKSKEFETKVLKNDELSPTELNALGLLYYDKGDFETARSYYIKAITIEPRLKNTHNNLGNVYADMGKFEEALASYKKAIEIDPLYTNPMYNIGSLYFSRRVSGKTNGDSDYVIAKGWFEKVLEHQPDYFAAHQSLGRIHLEFSKGESSEELRLAESYLQKAIKLKPEDSMSLGSLAFVYYYQGRFKEAEVEMIKASKLGMDMSKLDKLLAAN